MKNYINQIMQQAESMLADFEICECNIINDSLKIVHHLQSMLTNLREKIKTCEFEEKEDEIFFFKVQKPELLGKLLYFYKIYRIETQCPNGSNEVIKNYLSTELDNLTYFFNRNLDFYQYYRSCSTVYDEYYFIRGKVDIRLCTDSAQFDKDPHFSTGYDYKVAKIIANEMLRIYLNQRIKKLENLSYVEYKKIKATKSSVRFTGKKSALIEIGYSLVSAGDINHGNIEIKELMDYLGAVFNTDLGDYYAAYIAMKERKNRTAYLHHLIDSLIKRMNEDDMK